MHCRTVRLKQLRYSVPHRPRLLGDQAGMARDVQQHKSDQHRDLRHREGCIRGLASRDMQLGINCSHRERFVKVHMTNIATAGGRVCETNLSIQICPVEVNLTTVLVDDIARLLDAVLEHTEGRWVRDLGEKIRPRTKVVFKSDAHHESREIVSVLLRLRTEVRNVEAAIWQTLHRDHLQASHDCGLDVFQRRKVTALNDSLTAGFVPCALTGMRHMFLWPSPRDSW